MARKPKTPTSAPPAFVLTDEETKKLNDWLGRLIVKPVRTQTPTGPFLRWLAKDEAGAVHVYTWTPETDEELAKAEVYYDAAHARGAFALPIKPHAPIQRSAEELALIRGIIENRDDLIRYLVYADYLTENGNTHGDFIRVCAQKAQTSPDDPHYTALDEHWSELVTAHAEKWHAPLIDLGLKPDLKGAFCWVEWLGPHGVIDRVCIKRPEILPGLADRLFAAAPLLRRLELRDNALDDPKGFAGVPQIAQIDELDVSLTELTPAGLRAICGSKYLTALRDLNVAHNPFGPAGARALSRSPLLARLTRLDAGTCELGDDGFRELVSSPGARNLCDLTATKNGLTAASLHALAGSQLGSLIGLYLERNRFDADGLSALATAPFVPTLAHFKVTACYIDEDCARAIAALPFRALRTLSVSTSRVGSRGLTALVAAPFFTGLHVLHAHDAELDDECISEVSVQPTCELRELRLDDNHLTDTGLISLARSAVFKELTFLDLSYNTFTPQGVRQFVESAGFPALRELKLTTAELNADTCQALATSPHFGNLRKLSVTESLVSPDGKAVLIERFGEGITFR